MLKYKKTTKTERPAPEKIIFRKECKFMTIKCPNCNSELDNDMKFCINCGQKIEMVETNQNREQQNKENSEAQTSNLADAPAKPEKDALPKKTFKLSKKAVTVGGVFVALVLAIVAIISAFSGGKGGNYALYIKDNEIYYTSVSKIEPWQVTSRLIEKDMAQYVNEISFYLGVYTQMTRDGKIFFADKISGSANGLNLYYRDVNKPKQEPVKIDSEIEYYLVNESGDRVTYLKQATLYQHNLKDKEKIAGDVDYFRVSYDGKKVIYLNHDDVLYLQYIGKDKEKIDSDVSEIIYIDDDLKNIYYKKDGSLYKKTEGKDKIRIASEVYSVIKVYPSGEAFYIKHDDTELKLNDYVEDDMRENDSTMKEPVAPKSPSIWDYDSYDDYWAAKDLYDLQYAEYLREKENYEKKKDRDRLRSNLSEETMTVSSHMLYYYDGEKEIKLTDSLVYDGYRNKYNSEWAIKMSGTFVMDAYRDYTVADNKPVIIFSARKQSAVKKAKLSELSSVFEVKLIVNESLYSDSENFIAVKGNVTAIELEDAQNFLIDPDGKTVYFFDNISDKNSSGKSSDVYKMSISDNKPQKPELYDSDVSLGSLLLTYDNKVIYLKDAKNYKGDFYIDKERIDYDVEFLSIHYLKDSDTFIYMVDWNDKNDSGTLKICKNGKVVKIADDVHDFEYTPSGVILYLCDYSSKYKYGDLYIYKNNKSEKIDDEVAVIIPIIDTEFKYRNTDM